MNANAHPYPAAPGGRLILDASSLVRWTGPPVGIIRVEHALVAYVLGHRPDVVLCFHDAATTTFRRLRPHWVVTVTGWHGAIDTIDRDFRRHLPLWRRCLPSRYPVVMGLERLRLTTSSSLVARVASALQRFTLALRPGDFPFADRQGRRITIVPFDLAVGEDLQPGAGDVVLSAGSDWFHKRVEAVAALRRQAGFRLAVLCYDIIPLIHPEFFLPEDVARFRAHWLSMFALADCIIFNSRRIEQDAHDFCAAEGVHIGPTRVVRLGFEPPALLQDAARVPLRSGLEPGRFALFVSTIEPRKGHRLLVDAWRELLARGIPQRHRFKLVFAGRPGWMVDELLREIADGAAFGGTLLHLAAVADAELAGLYRDAAFCLYPSLYEGFGLPIVEAFSHGKAVIASTGGAVPETVAGLSPCLDPGDRAAWVAMLAAWIEDPAARAPYEALICKSFTHGGWEASAAALLEAAEATRLAPASAVPA